MQLPKATISVIIPAYNEAETIGQLIEHIRQNCDTPALAEIIVSDGGSSDQTAARAKQLGVVTISGVKQRAAQLNNGAAHAKGSILYFVHADSLPPAGFDTHIIQALSMGYSAGCFRLRFDDNHPILRVCAWLTRFNWNWFRFGDQSLFTSAATFKDIGGYDESLLVNEDREIVDRLKKRGPLKVCPAYIVTSARKYRLYGYFRLQLFFIAFNILYNAGMSQPTLMSMYQKFLRHQRSVFRKKAR